MLTKFQHQALNWLRRCYFQIEEVPIVWDPKHKRLSTNPQLRKWILWWNGNIFVFILWSSCVYTLTTQFIFNREGLKLLPICILTTGFCCFSATLASAHGITALRKKLYISSLNEYISLEFEIYKEYYPAMLDSNRRMDTVDAIFLVCQFCNMLPYLIYIVCMVWNLDGPYWVLEDFASDNKHRNINTILLFLLIRTFLLVPGFLETTRTLIYSCLGYLGVIVYLQILIKTLTHEVRSQTDFFRYYTQLCILSNVLGPAFERASFLACSTFYFLFIQTLWICVCGFGELEIAIYMFFASYALVILTGFTIFLPLVSSSGEVINNVRRIKTKQIKSIYCSFRTNGNKVYTKKAAALQSIRFSYGSYYPLGKKFCRNIFDNAVQHLLSLLLLFDLSGERH